MVVLVFSPWKVGIGPTGRDVVRIFESDVCDVDMVENPDSVIFDVDSCFQAHNI